MDSIDLKLYSTEELAKTGYPLEVFVENRDFMEQFVCVICLGVYRDPTTLFPCGHTLCKSCACELITKNRTRPSCPRCRKVIMATLEVFDLKCYLKQQQAVCPMRGILEKPCVWTGTLETIDAHVAKDCQFRVARCRCGKHLHKCDFLKNEVPCNCPEANCRYCNFKFFTRIDHESACGDISDPHACGEFIKRKERIHHEKFCPDIEVECKFCSVVCLRKNKKKHNEYECTEALILCKKCVQYVKRREFVEHEKKLCKPSSIPGMAWFMRQGMKSKITDTDF